MFRVRIESRGESFAAAPGETLLGAALRHGVAVRYGCRRGQCSSCKYRLLSGEVEQLEVSPYSLSEAEREEGWILLCQSRPTTDIVLEERVQTPKEQRPVIPPEERVAAVRSVRPLSPFLWSLEVELDRPLGFYSGQFVELRVPGSPDGWRAYSIASPPSANAAMHFVVKRFPRGAFSGELDTWRPGFRLDLRGPYGTSYLRDGARPVLLVATGAGIAPHLSMLREAGERQDPREYRLFYGARHWTDLVFLEELERLEHDLPDFRVVPSVSQPDGSLPAEVRVGRVTSVLQQLLGDGSGYDAYLSGAPEACEAVRRQLEAKGIAEDRLFLEKFYPAVARHVATEGEEDRQQ
jgi:NAD(P)H-flavin reductase/ferredoxin